MNLLPGVLSAMQCAQVDERTVKLTQQLSKDEWRQYDAAMKAVRGKYVVGSGCHLFPAYVPPGPLLADLIERGEVPPANRYHLHPTPGPVIDACIDLIAGRFDYREQPIRILEPNGGLGGVALRLQERFPTAQITIVEIDPVNCRVMEAQGLQPICADFLTWQAPHKFDLIVMNPPFDGLACCAHFLHALGMMERLGQLLCILPDMIQERAFQTTQAATVMDTIWRHGFCDPLPPKSFKETAGNVDTFIGFVNGLENPRDCVDRMIIETVCDGGVYNRICKAATRLGDLYTDLFGTVQDERFLGLVRDEARAYMKQAGLFFNLSPGEWQALADEWHWRITES